MIKWMLLLSLSSVFAFAAEIKDVSYSCGAKECSLRFQFASAKDLPNFFQKYDANAHKLTIGFSNTKTSLQGTSIEFGETSGLRAVRVFTDASFQVPLLKFEFLVGTSVQNDRNPVSLSNQKNFVIALPKVKAKSWSLQKLSAEKSSLEKKSKSDSLVALKKAKADSVQKAKTLATEAKKRTADRLAALKKAKSDRDPTSRRSCMSPCPDLKRLRFSTCRRGISSSRSRGCLAGFASSSIPMSIRQSLSIKVP